MARYCAGCGRRIERAIGGLCPECYVSRYGVARVPSRIELVYCKYCGSYKSEGSWSEGAGSIEETVKYYTSIALARRLRPSDYVDEAWVGEAELVDSVKSPHGEVRLRVVIEGSSSGLQLSEEKVVAVSLRQATCPSCTARITKRGYEAEVQIRSSEGRMSDRLRSILEEAVSSLERGLRDAIIDYKETRHGVDLLVRDYSTARVIAEKLKSMLMARVIETSKVVGRRRDGGVKKRYTISVRIPDVDQGDLIEVGGSRYFVLSRSSRGILALNLSTGREETLRPETLWRRGFTKYPGGPEVRRYMLLSSSGDNMVFLDADSGYREVVEASRDRVRVLVGDLREGDEYLVYRGTGRIYVLGKA